MAIVAPRGARTVSSVTRVPAGPNRPASRTTGNGSSTAARATAGGFNHARVSVVTDWTSGADVEVGVDVAVGVGAGAGLGVGAGAGADVGVSSTMLVGA